MFGANKTEAVSARSTTHFFWWVIEYPKQILMACVALILLAAIGLSGHHKDPSFDVFLAPQNPVLLAKEKSKEYFNVGDVIAVSMATKDATSIFAPEHLSAFRDLHNQLLNVSDIRANDVRSIVSETYMANRSGDLLVEDILPSGAISNDSAQLAWEHVQSMPPLMDTLVSKDASALRIILPVEDPDNATNSYAEISALASEFSKDGLRVDVAGTAAANARFADLIDLNTATFTPAAIIVVLTITFIALRQWNAMIGPLLVLAGAVAITLGSMGWMGFHYYMISTALPVVVMAIAIADCLHISMKYFALFDDDPQITPEGAARAALEATWKPVLLTSLTTIFGFAGLGLSTSIPPLKEFAFFASLGVVSACVFSLLIVPVCLVIFQVRPKTSPKKQTTHKSRVDALLLRISRFTYANPLKSISGAVLTVGLLMMVGLNVQFDNGVDIQFKTSDKIRISNSFMKERFSGNGTVNTIVQSDTPEAVLTPEILQSIQDLQQRISEVAVISKATSITDYISLMHHHLTGAEIGELPTRQHAPAQYMFLYESSSETNAFQEEIDFPRQNALIQSSLKQDSYHTTKQGVGEVVRIVDDWNRTNGLGLTAELTGRTMVTFEWMRILQNNHLFSVLTAAVFVFIAIFAFLRNFKDAVVATLPVICGLTLIYATMVVLQIPLSPATSMCSAISTGLGVDFGVHLVEQIRKNRSASTENNRLSFEKYTLIARACFYSAVSLAIGLSVVVLSWVPTVQAYGFLIAVGALGALAGALILTPAITALSEKSKTIKGI